MPNGVDLLIVLLIFAYLYVMWRVYSDTRMPARKQPLSARVAPYHGGWFPRTPPVPDVIGNPASDWQTLRDLCPEDALPVIRRLERGYYEAHYALRIHEAVHPFTEADNVVELHPGHSIKVG